MTTQQRKQNDLIDVGLIALVHTINSQLKSISEQNSTLSFEKSLAYQISHLRAIYYRCNGRAQLLIVKAKHRSQPRFERLAALLFNATEKLACAGRKGARESLNRSPTDPLAAASWLFAYAKTFEMRPLPSHTIVGTGGRLHQLQKCKKKNSATRRYKPIKL